MYSIHCQPSFNNQLCECLHVIKALDAYNRNVMDPGNECCRWKGWKWEERERTRHESLDSTMSEGNYLKSIYTNLSVQLETVSDIAAINSAQPWGEFYVNLSSMEHARARQHFCTDRIWLAGWCQLQWSFRSKFSISHMPTALTGAACWLYTAQRKPKFKHDRS